MTNSNIAIINGPFWKAEASLMSVMTPPAPNPVLLYSEDFSDLIKGFSPPMWRDTKENNSLVEEDLFATRTLNSQTTFGTNSTKDNIHTHYNNAAAKDWKNYIFNGRMRFSNANSGIGVTFLSQFREDGAAQYYRIRRTSTDSEFKLDALGATVDGTTDSGVDSVLNTWYLFQIEVEDTGTQTNIRVKIWVEGTTAPTNYQIDAISTESQSIENTPLTSGTIGAWTADSGTKHFDDFKVVGIGPFNYQAMRNIYIDFPGTPPSDNEHIPLPGTVISICEVRKMTINVAGVDLTWNRLEAEYLPNPLEGSALHENLQNGKLSLLLLRTLSPADDAPEDALPEYQCLNGDINMELLESEANSETTLFELLKLEPVDTRTFDENIDNAKVKLPGYLSAHASGLSILGKIAIPWQSALLDAPFQLSKLFPEDGFHLTIENERLTTAEEQAWITAWRDLSVFANPKFPQNLLAQPELIKTPEWASLELNNIDEVPPVYWQMLPNNANSLDSEIFFRQGALVVIVSDQQVYDEVNPPTSLARIIPEMVKMEVNANDAIEIIIESGDQSIDDPEKAAYQASRVGEDWSESLDCSNLELAYDAVDTPRNLNINQGLPTPQWEVGEVLETPIVWAFMPLENGWAQLPVLNLTEQIYLDSGITDPEVLASNLENQTKIVKGAVAFGNSQKINAAEGVQNEQAWDITFVNAESAAGKWTLEKITADEFSLQSVELNLEKPEVTANGLLWFSNAKPRLEDALPDLDNWVNSIQSISLKSFRPEKRFFVPGMKIMIADFSFQPQKEAEAATSALLGDWTMFYEAAADMISEFVDKSIIPADVFNLQGLIWQRHPHLPMVQALPLTQSQSPPNYPSASRQLVPFELPLDATSGRPLPAGWSFSAVGGDGADSWLVCSAAINPAREWAGLFDLPYVSLSLPGLIGDPSSDESQTGLGGASTDFLPLQFRYDLPYTDEINALAQLPKEPQDPNEISPVADSPPLEGPSPLGRTDLEKHWQDLSNLANLSSADGVDAFVKKDDSTAIQNLVEPKTWAVDAEFQLEQYPGSLNLKNEVSTGETPLLLEKKSALKGISGKFVAEGSDEIKLVDTADNPFEILAHSMAAWKDENKNTFRDQRGLHRAATQKLTSFLKTKVLLEPTEDVVQLTTTTSVLDLQLEDGHNWQCWFKDLPAFESGTLNTFDRSQTRSDVLLDIDVDNPEALSNDVNDPEALSKNFNYLQGYEWRMSDNSIIAGEVPHLKIHQLEFYPLTLDKVILDGEMTNEIVLTGRLQLPYGEAKALDNLSNAVQLSFQNEGNVLKLKTLTVLSGMVEWPLSQEGNVDGEIPRLCFDNLTLIEESGNFELFIEKAQVKFLLFEKEWKVELTDLKIPSLRTTSDLTFPFDATIAGFNPKSLHLGLDFQSFNHELLITCNARLGSRSRLAFESDVCFHLAGPRTGEIEQPENSGRLFKDLTIQSLESGENSVNYSRLALQFKWNDLFSSDNLQMLPGIHLKKTKEQAMPGFAALTFEVEMQTDALPNLHLRSAFVESLLLCSWGQFLQDGLINTPKAIFESSSGDLTFGFTTQFDNAIWKESFLLNGFIEIKNLLSWPSNLEVNADNLLLVPDANTEIPLKHIRHGIRILLNQHEFPADIIIENAEGDLMFNLLEDKTWQFLAVAEHQLFEVDTQKLFDGATDALGAECRWTVVQEIRFVRPQRYKKFLDFLAGEQEGSVPPPETPTTETTEVADGEIPDQFTISGRVVNLIGRGVANAKVDFYKLMPNGFVFAFPKTLNADEDGNFSFDFSRTQLRVVNSDGTETYPEVFFEVIKNGSILLNTKDGPRWSVIRPSEFIVLEVETEVHPIPFLPRAVTTALGAAIDETDQDRMLLVEASAPFWVLRQPLAKTSASSLQFLPTGIQSGILSGLDDYPVSDPSDPQWQFLSMPFLGRLQETGIASMDLTEAVGGSDQYLQLDPVFNLYHHREQGETIPSFILSLSSWANRADFQIPFSQLNAPEVNRWARLDANSLEENWFRLLNPPQDKQPDFLQSITASLPDTPAKLSRSTTLTNAYIANRLKYPPAVRSFDETDPFPEFGRTTTLIWREDSLIQFPFVGNTQEEASLAWAFFGVQFQSFMDLGGEKNLFPAATVLPGQELDPSKALPLSFVVSPYLSMQFSIADDASEPKLIVSELLCQDAISNLLLPATSYITDTKEFGNTQEAQAAIIIWGQEMHRRLCQDSPIAILRFREIRENDNAAIDEAALATTYSFTWIEPILINNNFQRVFNLRTAVENLRFQEGQFGGYQIPFLKKNGELELAPPQVDGVQPIYLEKEAFSNAPWGLSAMGIHSRIAANDVATIGAQQTDETPKTEVWWQALQHFVQFRSSEDERPHAGLPALFRAKAIKSLLPTLPNLPAPEFDIAETLNLTGTQAERWQAILPGVLKTLPIGARAGVYFAFRQMLQRQQIELVDDPENGPQLKSENLVSGSVPVQHRFPRPVSLPANGEVGEDGEEVVVKNKALQPWASFFLPLQNCYHQNQPLDEAFFAECGPLPDRGLKLSLYDPVFGAISIGWNGELIFDIDSEAESFDLADWIIQLEFETNGIQFTYQNPVETQITLADETVVSKYKFSLKGTEDAVNEAISSIFSTIPAGTVIPITAKVRHQDGNPGFLQKLHFPLRIKDSTQTPLPLVPQFIHFEDPAYNRLLASAAANATVSGKIGDELHSVRLSTDRKVYNPNSSIAVRVDSSAPSNLQPANVTLILKRLDIASGTAVQFNQVTMQPSVLKELALPVLLAGEDPLSTGEALQLEIDFNVLPEPIKVILSLDIVELPVIPVPEAAYGLLRFRDLDGEEVVDCARFAWAPNASRIELVCPDDLLTEIVRRRAVFQWSDATRPGNLNAYRIQKIAANGSTHFPEI